MLIKCDLSHVFMDRHRRSVTIRDAELAIRNSDFLFACVEHLAGVEKDCGFAFFPEVYAIGDREEDVACIFRSPDAFPDGQPGAWTIPMFSLWAPADAFGSKPLILRFLDNIGPDALFETVVRPLIASMLRLLLDFGCAFLGHGQNIHLEIGRDGLPTGRAVFSDMEDLWPHPNLCERSLCEAYPADESYRRAHAASPESDLASTFQDYFLWKLLHPLLLCLESSPITAPSIRRDTNDCIRQEVLLRAEKVKTHRDGPLAWFFETYLGTRSV